ncbi:MAG: hypothetical protein ACOY71_11010 [Gemmatimonadota bacterium]
MSTCWWWRSCTARRPSSFIFEALWPASSPIKWSVDTDVDVRHSVSYFDEGISSGSREDELITRRGETDIQVEFAVRGVHGDLRLVGLIENKIDANFTELQPQRYASRARRMLLEQGHDQVRTLLVAPAEYLTAKGAAHFDAQLSYEAVRDYFFARCGDAADGELSRRWEYRGRLLDQAIKQYRRTGVTVLHPGVSSFRQAYFERVTSLYPDIGMRRPSPSGQWAGDAWMEFYDAFGPNPPIRGEIKHKCPRRTAPPPKRACTPRRACRPGIERIVTRWNRSRQGCLPDGHGSRGLWAEARCARGAGFERGGPDPSLRLESPQGQRSA